MRAIVYRHYGPPDVLRLEEIEKPVPKDDEVLIRIRASSVNPYDWHFMRGEPRFFRLMMGLSKPKVPRLGADAAGVVEAVGRNVTDLKPGDEVFGGARGAFAEYACARASKLALKPANVSFEQAACGVVAGLTALQALRDRGRIRAGHKVLINGASGGVGTFAVQMARAFGAEVTGVCSKNKVELVRSIGATRVIDYTQEDFARDVGQYDIAVDCFWNHTPAQSKRVLKRDGTYVIVGAPAGHLVKGLLWSLLPGSKIAGAMTKSGRNELDAVAELLKTGKVTPVIDRRYPLDEVPAAIRYLEEGHARGKVVIAIA
jgi:NADPH:quinone reductase-like Zn-dependent oxidoreductase